jgi:hypothetical protein
MQYVIGGLEAYLRRGCSFRRNVGLKQAEVMGALARLKYHPQSVAWAIDLRTYEPVYYLRDREFAFDPRHYILGTFLRPTDDRPAPDKSRYKISKR